VESFVLVSNLLLSLGKVTTTCLANLGWCYATARMANQLLILKGEALIKLQNKINVMINATQKTLILFSLSPLLK